MLMIFEGDEHILDKNQLLDYFGVKSHQELMIFVKNNPTNKKVMELNELLTALEIDFTVENEGEIDV